MLTGSPSTLLYSRLPASAAIWAKFVFSVRKRPTSSSGLIPSSSRRNTLRMRRSPNTTELLLCSATERAASRRTVYGPRSGIEARRPLVGGVGKRKLVCLGVASRVRHDHGRQVGAADGTRHRNQVGDDSGLQASRLAREPPAISNVSEKHVIEPLLRRSSE